MLETLAVFVLHGALVALAAFAVDLGGCPTEAGHGRGRPHGAEIGDGDFQARPGLRPVTPGGRGDVHAEGAGSFAARGGARKTGQLGRKQVAQLAEVDRVLPAHGGQGIVRAALEGLHELRGGRHHVGRCRVALLPESASLLRQKQKGEE